MMRLTVRFFKKIILICLCLIFTPMAFASASSLWLQVINLGGAKDIQGHNLHYTASISDDETLVNSSPLDGNIAPIEKNTNSAEGAPGIRNNSAIMDIYRYDNSEITASLKITDALANDRVIWEGKVTNNPTTNETMTAVAQIDDKHYNIHIEQNKPDQPSHMLIMLITNKE